MAEKVFKSAGVFATETDLSRPSSTGPSGIPAGVIGTSTDGPAFVPITVGSYDDFSKVFGDTDGEKFGPLAVYTFLQQASALTYLKVLGAGDGLRRDAGTGKVNRAGFVVGGNMVQNNGLVEKNPYAIQGSVHGEYGQAGRTAFLGCFMSASEGSTVFDEAGLTFEASTAATLTLTLGAHTNVANNDTIILVDSHGVTLTATADTGAGAHDDGYVDSDYTVTAGGDITVSLKTNGMVAPADLAQSIADMVNGAATHKSFGITTPVWTAGASVVLTGGTGAIGNTNTVTVTNVGGTLVSDFSAPAGLASGVPVTFSGGRGSAFPVIRGVVLFPSGVVGLLSGSNIGPVGGKSAKPSSTAAAFDTGDAATNMLQGGPTGSVNPATGDFVLLLNGHISTDSYPNVISASFKMGDNYFANKLNTDPTLLQEAGHLLYSHFDISNAFAVVTGSGVTIPQCYPASGAYANSTAVEDIGFILTGSQARNTAVADVSPDYESFQDRFKAARTPFFISQDYGGTKHNLFRVHARGDGASPSTKYKVSIENIKPANEVATDKFGTFDLFLRDINDTDQLPVRLESHIGLTMDPSSEKYIGRVIGDQRVFFDFDQAPGSQKLVVEGNHAGNSSRIRVEIPRAVELGYVPDEALPMGFRGPDHLVTSGSGPLASLVGSDIGEGVRFLAHKIYSTDDIWKRATVLPLRYRRDIRASTEATTATIHSVDADSTLYWGVQFKMRTPSNLITNAFGTTERRSLNDAAADFDTSLLTRMKYFPNFGPGNFNFSVGNNPGVADINGTVLDCDKFNNNLFTLERIRVKTGSSGDIADPLMWSSASYIRKGNISADKGMRALKVEDLRTSGNRTFAKFTTFLQGGFDGVNIFNDDLAKLSSTACKREMDDSTNQGGTKGATVATYRKAIDIMGVKADVDINLLSIPGIRNAGVTDYAITAVENRFDALYIMDIEQRDEDNMVMTGSKTSDGSLIIPSILNTASGFAARGLDSSFAAAYYPNISITDPTTGGTLEAPPSVGVMGVMAQNDKLGRPWFAPAGYTRGKLDSSIEGTSISLERADLNRLYEVSINPLVSFAGEDNSVVWGQKTLQANASALDRINVRRLLIDIRRKVKNIANSLLFEPNRQETLDKFNALVKPVMQTVQQQQGVDRFKVIIDTTTTTQADVENNTIRGKIYLQPTRTAEFISLDFTVTNAGNFDSV